MNRKLRPILAIFALALLVSALCRTLSSMGVFRSARASSASRGACGSLCTSRDCIVQAGKMSERMNEKSHQCDDFHEFVCGEYPVDTPIDGSADTTTVYSEAAVSMYAKLKMILESDSKAKRGSIQSIRHILYQSCMNSDGGRKELKTLIKWVQTFAVRNWPQVHYSADNVQNWLVAFHIFGGYSFFKLQVWMPSADLEVIRRFGIDAPDETGMQIKMTTDKSFFLESCRENEIDDWKEYVLHHLLASTSLTRKRATEIIRDFIMVDEKIMEMNQTETDTKTVNCVHGIASFWCDMLLSIVNISRSDLNHTLVRERARFSTELLDVYWFFKSITKSAMANYLVVRFLANNMKHMGMFNKFERMPCTKDTENAWHTRDDPRYNCISYLCSTFPFILTKDYIQRTHGVHKFTLFDKIFWYVKQAAVSYVNGSLWMSESVKEEVSHSVSQMWIETIEYIKFILSFDFEKSYHWMSPTQNNFALNILEIQQFNQIYQLRNYETGAYGTFLMSQNPFRVEASSGEAISVAFGFLEMAHFEPSQPLYLAFGAAGMVLGHELTHEINLLFMQSIEFNSTDETYFKGVRLCLSDMYARFMIPEVRLRISPGSNLREDFPDVLGAHFALMAYKDYIKDHSLDKSLPSMNFSNERMMSIAMGQLWCEIGDKRSFKFYLGNHHSPGKFRALGPLMNNPEFSRLFNCREGSAMNYEKRCNL